MARPGADIPLQHAIDRLLDARLSLEEAEGLMITTALRRTRVTSRRRRACSSWGEVAAIPGGQTHRMKPPAPGRHSTPPHFSKALLRQSGGTHLRSPSCPVSPPAALSLAKPYWTDPVERRLAWVLALIILALAVAFTELNLWLNELNKSFYDALQNMNAPAFQSSMARFFTAVGILVVVATAAEYSGAGAQHPLAPPPDACPGRPLAGR
jgi:hypothetical protein